MVIHEWRAAGWGGKLTLGKERFQGQRLCGVDAVSTADPLWVPHAQPAHCHMLQMSLDSLFS